MKDYNGNRIKCYLEFECTERLTVGKLKEMLNDYSDDTLIYIESSNISNKGDTGWAQKALDTYPTNDKYNENKKALVIVGTLR